MQLAAYTGDRGQAQDLVQEAFCRAFARWDRLAGYDDPLAWVRRVAWNLGHKPLAAAAYRPDVAAAAAGDTRRGPEPGPGGASTPPWPCCRPNQRRAVVLHYLADLSVTEIAAQEGVPEGTVKSWLHRGRAALAHTCATRTR